MGATTRRRSKRQKLTRVKKMIEKDGSGRPADEAIQEDAGDPFLQRSLEIDEKIRSGRNRPLSKEEGQRFFDRIMRSQS